MSNYYGKKILGTQDVNESVCIEMCMRGAASLSGFTYLGQGVDQFCSICVVS